MKSKNVSGTSVEDCSPPETETHSCAPPEIFPEKNLPPSQFIDFRAPEFNVTDDLDDNLGNYRNFQALEGIMTADMRHHMERKNRHDSEYENNTAPAPHEKPVAGGANETAGELNPSPLTIISQGKTLILGTDSDRILHCGELLAERGLTCTLCLVAKQDPEVPQRSIEDPPLTLKQVDSVSVHGSFGGFAAEIVSRSGGMKSGKLPEEIHPSFDLVLDLQSVPSFAGTLLPLGYYTPGIDKELLEIALTELPEMKGRFTKPYFALLRESRCLHGRSRSSSCQRCIAVCPVAAIRSVKGGIAIDPHLCQGCGSCALVCPADAIRMLNPSREELLYRVRGLLAEHAAGNNCPPVLVMHGEDISPETLQGMTGNIGSSPPVLCEVAQIGRVGLDVLLAALAYGAGCVVMLCSGDTPPDTIQALERQKRIGAAILQGLKIRGDRLSLHVAPSGVNDSDKPLPQFSSSAMKTPDALQRPANFPPDHEKRSLIRLAVRHLHEVSGGNAAWIALPSGAPFGAVALDRDACTLCMACAGICPSGALAAGGDMPRLSFKESACHQCGLCLEACPEGALQLMPRLLCTDNDHDHSTVLQEAEPFTCVECGAPFASAGMIKNMQEKLAGHWMYRSDRQIRRLRMCRSCRARDALLARDFHL